MLQSVVDTRSVTSEFLTDFVAVIPSKITPTWLFRGSWRKTFHHIRNLLLKTTPFQKVCTEFVVTRRKKLDSFWRGGGVVETLKLITVYSTKLKFILSSNKQQALLHWGKEYFVSTSTHTKMQPRRTLNILEEYTTYIREFYGKIF